ncbi:MAG: TrbI/VirB10 family protein, partial [Pseudonocardiaceae bacterium]
IPLVFVGGVNSDLPGQVVARVSRNVFDTATGRYLLIPQGTTVLGSYDSQVTHGQSRVLIAWNRLIYPDGSSIDIGSMSSTDRSGMAGARDQINRHSLRTYGNAVFLSIFSAGAQLSQPQASNGENVSAGQTVAAAMGQQIGQLGMESARRGLQVQPTLQIRPGFQGNLLVQQDLVLREWRRQR